MYKDARASRISEFILSFSNIYTSKIAFCVSYIAWNNALQVLLWVLTLCIHEACESFICEILWENLIEIYNKRRRVW